MSERKPSLQPAQAAIARAIRAVEQTGARMTIEIATDGTIRLIPSAAEAKEGADSQVAPFGPRLPLLPT